MQEVLFGARYHIDTNNDLTQTKRVDEYNFPVSASDISNGNDTYTCASSGFAYIFILLQILLILNLIF